MEGAAMRNTDQVTGRATRRARLWFCAMVVSAVVFAGMVVAAPTGEYTKRQTALDKQLAAEHYALGTWCDEQKLFSEAREQFERALSLDADHKTAAQKLGVLTKVVRRAKNLNCEFRLANGDRMKAEFLLRSFKVKTPAGFLIVPTSEVDVIQFGAGPNPDHIISDRYVGEGRLRAESFSAKSKAGPITVKRQDISSLRILRPCEGCEGEGDVTCARCGGRGRLKERSVCPTCDGKGTVKCQTCNGNARSTCPLCGGRGHFRGAWGRLRRVGCPRCNGSGKVDCLDCVGRGRVTCATCNGKPVTTKAGPCPVCNGRKVAPCKACGGTGVRPVPKPEDEAETEAPPKVGEGGQP